ncbi:MAG: hypothetical protein HY319_32495 [Armatimonadetes bacterium]|nr:hypothetical protein [Armatimonadota bacterium]
MKKVLSPEQVLERVELLMSRARDLQELKEQMLYVETFGSDRTELGEELERHDSLVEEIQVAYRDGILPIVEELVAFLEEHPAELGRLLVEKRSLLQPTQAATHPGTGAG